MYGHDKMAVIRTPGSKWFVSNEDFPWGRYSKYCAGAAFLLSGNLIRPLYRRSFGTK